MMTTARDIMETESYAVPQDATVREVIEKLVDVQVSAVPIVTADMKPIGFITDVDLTRYIAHTKPRVYDWGEMMPVITDDESPEDKLRELLEAKVGDVMSRTIPTAEADTDILDLADLFKKAQVRKIAVTEKGKLVGIISRSSVLLHILEKAANK